MNQLPPPKKHDDSRRTLFREFLPIVFIPLAMKDFGISKSDFRKIQDSTSKHMSFLSLIGSISAFVAGIFFACFGLFGGWQDKVNVYSWIAAFSMLVGGGACTILLFVVLLFKSESRPLRLISDILFHASLALGSLAFFVADLKNGDLNLGDSVSGSIAFLLPLALCQPGYWLEAVLFDILYLGGYASIIAYGSAVYGMHSIEVYAVCAIAFVIASYCTYSAYSYVEFQRFYIDNRNEDLLSKSTHDSLTGARNRNGLRLYLEDRLLPWSHRHERVLAMMLDIDDFKLYNDTFGHLKGDDVLCAIVKAIIGIEGFHHIHVFRYGGEEFLILVSHIDEPTAYACIEAVRAKVESLEIKAPEGAPCKFVTVSLGGSLWQIGEGYLFHNHIEDADEALYEAKKSGKNRWVMRVHNLPEEGNEEGK